MTKDEIEKLLKEGERTEDVEFFDDNTFQISNEFFEKVIAKATHEKDEEIKELKFKKSFLECYADDLQKQLQEANKEILKRLKNV